MRADERMPWNGRRGQGGPMDKPYRIFGSEMSPYSVKVRSYFRFKQIPHQWVPRGPENEEDYKRFAR